MIEEPEKFYDCFNFGPSIKSNKTVWEVVNKVIHYYGEGNAIDTSNPNDVHEAQLLYVDPTKSYFKLGWCSVLSLDESIEYTVDWYKEEETQKNMYNYSVAQINAYYEKGLKTWEQ